MDSPIKIYVERNLGFEAEHHARDLGGINGVIFHQVSGITNSTKKCITKIEDIFLCRT
jgi:hypothetical protein